VYIQVREHQHYRTSEILFRDRWKQVLLDEDVITLNAPIDIRIFLNGEAVTATVNLHTHSSMHVTQIQK